MKILGLGDNIVDRFLDRGMDYPGGNAVNVAVYTHRLGAESSYLGVFGSDDLGAFIRNALAAEGIGVERSLTRDGESGISTLHVVDGDRTFLGWNNGGVTVREPIDLADGRLDYVAGFDLAHTSVYSGVEDELHRLSRLPTRISFDFSSEPEHRTPEYFAKVAPHIDLGLISCSEEDEEGTRKLLSRMIDAGAGLALGTRGTEGAIVTDGENWRSEPALLIEDPSRIVDTMGCGDAFVSGFVVSLLADGWPRGTLRAQQALEEALRAGARASRDQCFVEAAFGRGRPITGERGER